MFFKKKIERKQSFIEYEKKVLERTVEQEFIAQRVRFSRDRHDSSYSKFLFFKYDSHLPIFEGYVNYGDYIQTIATQLAVESVVKPGFDFDFVDRDSLFYYLPSEGGAAGCACVMQGWFAHTLNFFPNENVHPIWIGTHFDRIVYRYIEDALAINPFFFRGEVGCRDLSTLDFLNNLGVKSYFSRCLTLTLPRRKLKEINEEIYFVDMPDQIIKLFPQRIRERAVKRNQRWCFVGHECWKKTYKHAREILNDIQKARLVITSALHCAAPCVAMGIPVILVCLDPFENINRFSALNGILNAVTVKEIIDKRISYDVFAPDIEDLKRAMLENVSLVIKSSVAGGGSNGELKDLRDYISNYSVAE